MKKFLIILVSFLFLPSIASAATLFVSPSSGSFSVGSTFTVSVRTNTQSQPVNTAEASISYSTDTLELVGVSQGSTFYLPAPGSPSKGSGTAYFGGGLPTPGYNGASGAVGTMTFRAKATGTGTVSITTGKVLLNDGLGTNGLSESSGARFTISPPPVGGPTVTSTTHPDSEKWFKKDSVELSWSRPTGAHGFSFELDQKPDTIPDNELDTTITTSKKYEDLKDGVWYFHIKARGAASGSAFSGTTHFRIGVDTQPPKLFDINLVGQSNLNDVTRTPTIEFEAIDETSGIEKYSVGIEGPQDGSDEVNGIVADNATSPFTFSKLTSGPHVIRVTAYDKAGNERKAELPVIITGPAAEGFLQKSFEIPMYMLIGVNVLALLLIALLLYFLLHRRRYKEHDAVSEIQAEIDRDLEDLKERINEKLLTLTARTSQELLAKEEKVAKEVTVRVSKARKNIDKKITKLGKTVKKQKPNIIIE